jgi:hypothetical protein
MEPAVPSQKAGRPGPAIALPFFPAAAQRWLNARRRERFEAEDGA